MHKGKICILIAGIDNIRGHHSLEIKEYFGIERYSNAKIGTDYYYALFNNDLNKRNGELTPNGFFSEFVIYLGLRGYAFRLDRLSIFGDSAVDYVIKIVRMKHIIMPQNLGKR